MAGIGDYEGVGSFTMPGWSGWVNDPKAKTVKVPQKTKKDSPTDFNIGGLAQSALGGMAGKVGGAAMGGLGGVL